MKLDGALARIEHEERPPGLRRRRPPAAGGRARRRARAGRARVRRQHPRHRRRRGAHERERLRRRARPRARVGRRLRRRRGPTAARPSELGFDYRRSNLGPREVVARASFALEPQRPRAGEGGARGPARPPQARPSRRASRPSARPSRTPTTRARRAAPRASCSRRRVARGCEVGRRALLAQARELHREPRRRDHDATCCALIAEGRRRVRERFGVELEPEVQLLGDIAFPSEAQAVTPGRASCSRGASSLGAVALIARGAASLGWLSVVARLVARARRAREDHRPHDPRRAGDPAHPAPGRHAHDDAALHASGAGAGGRRLSRRCSRSRSSADFPNTLVIRVREHRPVAALVVRRRPPGRGGQRRDAAAAQERDGSLPAVKVDAIPARDAARRGDAGRAPGARAGGRPGAAAAAARPRLQGPGRRAGRDARAGRRCGSARRRGWRRSGPRPRACWPTRRRGGAVAARRAPARAAGGQLRRRPGVGRGGGARRGRRSRRRSPAPRAPTGAQPGPARRAPLRPTVQPQP